ncbi:major facilitator superfamily domain-containing protein [Cokeromyces recurvatus]|uniref:major facilitator superfamily domain-containing protein n=1 Tax=Cokeromyces recurvatus TaxID=90255 RepID=UPI00221FCC78|nr:major facilitator superfamily domain-containing protein [Cokeromyces recurvatus]KAI7900320.1 major facilitator superfamily domain-containing protein [Cokeromyces recurvatus]
MTEIVEDSKNTLKGVKMVELYKLVWSKYDKWVMFCGLILLSWAINFESGISSSLTVNVTSLFQTNNLISILSTVLYILQTALYPIYSKLSDMYGRAQMYTIALFFYIVTYIAMACANNYETLVGGQIIYAFGYTGVAILGPITIADFTNVVNRGLMQSLYNVPSLINLFLAPRAADALYYNGNWRWGYGMIPIILLVTCLPVLGTLWKLYFQVRKRGLLKEYKAEQIKIYGKAEKMNFIQRIIWLGVEIDIIGSILLIAGLCLILLPLVLATTSWGGWSSGKTIGTLIAGVAAWALFGIWEWRFAAKPVIPITRWESRTPLYGVCALSTVTIISSTNWQYYTTYLMISRDLTVSDAILLERGYNVAYIICEFLVGILMKRFRVWKPFVWTGVSLIILGVGLMIPARLPTSSDAFVVISQTIVGIGSGFLYTPMLVAIQSSVPHDDMAIATAMMQIGGSIAASIGSTMAGSIWNNMLPGQLAKYVPGEYNYEKIVGSIPYALSLPKEQYDGVVTAYGHVQMILSIIAICIAVLTFCFTIPMKSFGLESYNEESQTNESEDEFSNIEKPYTFKTDNVHDSPMNLHLSTEAISAEAIPAKV